jgi:hypothetical protein
MCVLYHGNEALFMRLKTLVNTINSYCEKNHVNFAKRFVAINFSRKTPALVSNSTTQTCQFFYDCSQAKQPKQIFQNVPEDKKKHFLTLVILALDWIVIANYC